ncbi:MAG: FAD-dependent monooxygenase [Ktedonobacterales bacterium]
MARGEHILIVGGGIAGLTLATALHQQGFSPELVERSPEWPAIGAGIMLQANGLRVLRALGLAAAVEQAGAVVRHWAWCDQQGEVLSNTDLVAGWGGVGPCVGIARPALQQVLLEGAMAVPYRLGSAVTSLTQDVEHQGVRVGFSDGSSGEYDLVIGADGLGSTVRELALGTSSIDYTGVMMWRSIVPDADARRDRHLDDPAWRGLSLRAGADGRGTHLRLWVCQRAAAPRSTRGAAGKATPALCGLRRASASISGGAHT